ncbi:MAG: oligopeptide transport system substrate-binding protein [Candidatus Azotimanducaceae bacterium]|jgi:oligopeptide transport system substrate-binding protein
MLACWFSGLFCRWWLLYTFGGLVVMTVFAPPALSAAVDSTQQTITIALTQEPPSLNATQSTDVVSFFVLGHVNEGLVRYDRRGRVVPAGANDWVAEDNHIDFTLRDDARWSDGSEVTAADYVYAWQLLLDPDTAAPYASIMLPIKNAAAIIRGDLPPTALGVKALSTRQLRVQLERPCGYCISLMAHAAFYPIKQEFHEIQGSRYGAEADTLLYNGPFTLSHWTHGAQLTLTRNPHYWDRETISLTAINIDYITEDNRARLNLFRDGSIALAKLGAETVADAVSQKMRLRTFATGGLSYLRINVDEGRLMAELKLRHAMSLVFDSDEFVNKVIGIPGYKPSTSFFPSWLPGDSRLFAEEHPPLKSKRDLVLARQLVDEVRRENGDDNLPAITLLTVASPTGAKVAEYLQGLAAQHLGLTVKIDQQTFKQYLAKAAQGDFDMAISSWYPDFNDVMTYADLLASWNGNNRGHYDNPEYDRWLEILQSSAVVQTRMEAAAQLQDIIVNDVPVIPMAETGSAYLQHPKLRGVVRRVIGPDPDYSRARVVP